jgi:hypothetical protein
MRKRTWILSMSWPPVRRYSDAKQLADKADDDLLRVHTEVVIPLRQIREGGDHVIGAIADDMARPRRPREGGTAT